MKDIKNKIKQVIAVPIALAASLAPAKVDLKGYRSAVFGIYCQAATYTSSAKIVWTLEDSDDDVTYTAVASTFIDGELPSLVATLAADKIVKVGYLGGKRYVKAVPTLTGTLATTYAMAIATLGHPDYAPVAS